MSLCFLPAIVYIFCNAGTYFICAYLSQFNSAVLLAIIVEKSKKCLDFSVTLFLIHIVTCSIYGGFPSTWDWWIIHVMGMIAMVVLGEYLCSKKELSDIPLLQL